MTKQDLEEKTSDFKPNNLMDGLKIIIGGACLSVVMSNFRVSELIEKIGLINNPVSSARFLGYSYLNVASGIFAGFTNRYKASAVLFTISLFPELFDSYNEGILFNVKRVAAKTAIIYGSWALGKIGRTIYELNTNKAGVDLF